MDYEAGAGVTGDGRRQTRRQQQRGGGDGCFMGRVGAVQTCRRWVWGRVDGGSVEVAQDGR